MYSMSPHAARQHCICINCETGMASNRWISEAACIKLLCRNFTRASVCRVLFIGCYLRITQQLLILLTLLSWTFFLSVCSPPQKRGARFERRHAIRFPVRTLDKRRRPCRGGGFSGRDDLGNVIGQFQCHYYPALGNSKSGAAVLWYATIHTLDSGNKHTLKVQQN